MSGVSKTACRYSDSNRDALALLPKSSVSTDFTIAAFGTHNRLFLLNCQDWPCHFTEKKNLEYQFKFLTISSHWTDVRNWKQKNGFSRGTEKKPFLDFYKVRHCLYKRFWKFSFFIGWAELKNIWELYSQSEKDEVRKLSTLTKLNWWVSVINLNSQSYSSIDILEIFTKKNSISIWIRTKRSMGKIRLPTNKMKTRVLKRVKSCFS